jgi:creatinine amidohydrolase
VTKAGGARPYVLSEATWKTVRDVPYDVAVLPWGATEAHNYHLPYGTDNLECDWLATEAARLAWERGARVAVLPTIPFGVNTGQADIRLCINMNPSTQAMVLRDVIASLEGQRVPKLVLFNGHGGNDFRQMIRELQPRTTVFLSTLNWWQVLDPAEYFTDLGDHAGELETSVMLHIAPDAVLPLAEAGEGHARTPRVKAFSEGWAWTPRQWTRVTADTGIGNPAGATAEAGAAYVAALTEKIGAFLLELAQVDPADLYE